jgi:MFS family permease
MIEELERRTIRKVAFRLLPLMVVMFFIAYVDRVNLSFAGPFLIKDLGLSSSLFGLASGIFFISYFLFEVPSNLIMERVGARLWIARIMITWGIVATATYLVTGPLSLLGMRFLLGIAEAGFFPGMILYLTYWFPAAYRSRVTAGFMIAIPISVVLSAPVSSAILTLHGWHGLSGWQWLFILEGIPAILLGVVVLVLLRDGPNDAAWLTDEEKRWLTDRLETERAAIRRAGHMGLWDGLKNSAVLWLSLLYLLIVTSSYGLLFFMPQIIQTFSDSIMSTGLLNAIPYATASSPCWSGASIRTGRGSAACMSPVPASSPRSALPWRVISARRAGRSSAWRSRPWGSTACCRHSGRCRHPCSPVRRRRAALPSSTRSPISVAMSARSSSASSRTRPAATGSASTSWPASPCSAPSSPCISAASWSSGPPPRQGSRRPRLVDPLLLSLCCSAPAAQP